MPKRLPRLLPAVVAIGVLAVVAAIVGRPLVRGRIEARLRAEAASRGMAASWQRLEFGLPARLEITGLRVTNLADSSEVVAADTVRARLSWPAALRGRADVRHLALSGARVRRAPRTAADPDTLAPPEDDTPAAPRSERLRRTATQLVQTLLLPARRLPSMALRDVELVGGDEEAFVRGVRIERLDVSHRDQRMQLDGLGALRLERDVPFEASLAWGRDDRLDGWTRFALPRDPSGHDTLRLSVNGRLTQDRRAGVLRLAPDSRVHVGELPLTLSGEISRDGPRVRFALDAETVTQRRIQESVPPAVLGVLQDVAVTGSFDYRLRFDLDFEQPDSVSIAADVVPHGLRLDPAGTHLPLFGLDRPFNAAIHLPRQRVVHRELSYGNPYFRPLHELDPHLVYAVVTNEDGGFFRHGGFNVEAMQAAMAENIEAGAFRRGAGTITMQLARNLYTGHTRTLSRKGQEIVLAWVLEHLTGVGKERLLEIYLNVIEWGPGIHGAGEAAWFYFGKSPEQLTVDEALFLTILVPSPSRWRSRFADDGSLRGYAKSQMHFIGRAMIRKGWLAAEALPPREALHVELRGPARDIVFPHGDSLLVEGEGDRNPTLPAEPGRGGFFDRLFRAVSSPFRRAGPDSGR